MFIKKTIVNEENGIICLKRNPEKYLQSIFDGRNAFIMKLLYDLMSTV